MDRRSEPFCLVVNQLREASFPSAASRNEFFSEPQPKQFETFTLEGLRGLRRMRVPLCLLLAVACGRGPVAASVSSLQVSPNALNPLSVRVSFDARGADCVRVVYATDGEPAESTPCVPAEAASSVAVLGLLPGRHYTASVEAWRSGLRGATAPLEFDPGPVPDDLLQTQIAISGDPPAGLVLTALNYGSPARGYAVAFDGQGRLRLVRPFGTAILETKQQPHGNLTTFVGSTSGWQDVFGEYVEYTPDGNAVDAWAFTPPSHADDHELLFSYDGLGRVLAAHYFTYDLYPAGNYGVSTAPRFAVHSLVRQAPGGPPITVYSSAGQVTMDDRIEPPDIATQPDLDHPNSLEFDRDGNYLASWRNLGEITKIDFNTGKVIWRLGGRRNEFTFQNDPLGGFSAQHSVRVLANGNLLLYDNGWRHDPQETRAAEYQLDVAARTATLVWEWRSGIFTPYTGSVQRLKDGNTLVGLANAQAVLVDPSGAEIWRSVITQNGTPLATYRQLRLASLYDYEAP